jgi:hypothetical protein
MIERIRNFRLKRRRASASAANEPTSKSRIDVTVVRITLFYSAEGKLSFLKIEL